MEEETSKPIMEDETDIDDDTAFISVFSLNRNREVECLLYLNRLFHQGRSHNSSADVVAHERGPKQKGVRSPTKRVQDMNERTTDKKKNWTEKGG